MTYNNRTAGGRSSRSRSSGRDKPRSRSGTSRNRSSRERERRQSRDAYSYELPALEDLQEELSRVRYGVQFFSVLRSTIFTLTVVASVAILVATLWMPVLRIYGVSMAPTLEDGNIILSVKDNTFKPGDIIAFYYNNKILVKRVVASSGEWVDIDESGNVYVNNARLEEPYLGPEMKAFGDTNIELPYQVPEGRIFVLGDNRAVSIDSRNTAVGCIAEEQIVGKLVFSIWPLSNIGWLNR